MTVTYQYFRLYMTGVQYEGTGGAVSIAEWKFFDGSGSAISTSGGTASASSTVANTPASAFDGSASTFWAGNPPTYSSPVWLQYEFTTTVTVGSFSLTNRNDMSLQDPSEWILQGSNNGSTWTNIGRYSTGQWTSASQTITFQIGSFGLSTAYRLNVTNNESGGGVTALAEFALYNGASQITTDVGGSATHGAAFSSTSQDGAGEAFDGNNSTYWASSAGTLPQWLAYGFSSGSEPAAITSFTITSRSGSLGQSPTAFTFDKSTDGGVTWTTLGSSYTTPGTWSNNETRTFTVTGAGGGGLIVNPGLDGGMRPQLKGGMNG